MVQLISQTQVELTIPCPCKTGASGAPSQWYCIMEVTNILLFKTGTLKLDKKPLSINQ